MKGARARGILLGLAGLLVASTAAAAAPRAPAQQQGQGPPAAEHSVLPLSSPSEETSLLEAAVALPLAAALGAALAFRPRRRGTPPRSPAVIHAQVILALVGALVMLVVGASLARAFGIVGAASLVRYRSNIDDPKDAGIMLSCLALGLAAGVGIYWVATASTLFILAVVWVLESQQPEGRKDFLLKVRARESANMQADIEKILRRNDVKYELRTSSLEDVTYSVNLPARKKTDKLTSDIVALGRKNEMAVEWSDRKDGA